MAIIKIPLRVFVVVCFASVCLSNPLKNNSVAGKSSFFCQYFSDGTNICYRGSRPKEASDTVDDSGREVYGAFGVVGLGDPIYGTWTTEDGFFTLSKKSEPKKHVGTCMFDDAHGFQCTGTPRCKATESGGIRCNGGGVFGGRNYSGTPGGRIKVEFRGEISPESS